MIHQVNIGESINYKMEIDDSEENIIVSIALSRLFWKLRFNLGSKGTYYLGRAILLAYINQELTFNNKELIILLH